MSRKAAAHLGFTVETPAIALWRSFSGNEVRGTFFILWYLAKHVKYCVKEEGKDR